MKTTFITKKYEEVMALPKPKHQKPWKQPHFWGWVLKVVSSFDLRATNFKYREIGMEKLGKKEPCLVLMNHSSFIDLEIVSTVLYPRRFNIVATSDSFMGIMNFVMRMIGCFPTKKFVMDPTLVRDMMYVVKELKSSVVMYPEASYSFDGTATTLPDSLGSCIKMLSVPVVMVRTYGAYTRDPLYNGLRSRKVDVSADVKYLLSAKEVKTKSAEEIMEVVGKEFSFDNFRWQQENKVSVTEPFRAEGLNRVLYRCPHCETEGAMEGTGTKLICNHCKKVYELTEYGFLQAEDGESKFDHVPDWYRWERECVKKEIESGEYHLEVPVDICILKNMKAIYRVGEGTLAHTAEGFHLVGCDGKIDYRQRPLASYSLYSDYYWYETGDVICIGNGNLLYYCFPKDGRDVVAKTRLATEEIYKIAKQKKNINK